MRHIALIYAASILLFLPLAGGCAPSQSHRRAHPREGAPVVPSQAPAEASSAAYASFSAGIALEMQAGHLEEIYAYQNMSTGVKQPSLIRDARRLRMQALGHMDRALAQDPDAAVIVRRKGDVLLELADAAGAMGLYRRAQSMSPAEERWYFKAAARLELLNRFSEAAEVLGWAAEPGSHVPQVLQAVALVEMGNIFARLEKLDDAERAYTAALALAVGRPDRTADPLATALADGLQRDPTAIRRTLIGVLKRRGKFDEALAQAHSAVKEAPEDVRAVLVLSGVYESMSDWANATTVIEQFLQSSPDNEVATFALMRLLASSGRTDDAVETGTIFLASKGPSAAIETEIIAVCRKAGRYDQAETFAVELEKKAPLDPRVAIAVIDMFLSENKTTEGMALATRTLKSLAGKDKYQQDVFAVIWGKTSSRQTEEFFGEYDKSHPDDFAAAHAYAQVLRSRGEPARAADVFVTLAERGAGFEDVYDVAALRLIDKGDDRAAMLIFLKGANSGFVRHPEATLSVLVDRCREPESVAEMLEGRIPEYRAALIPAYQLVARLYGRAEKNAKAEEYYRKAVEAPQPSLADYAGLAVSLYRQDKNDQAIQLVEKLRAHGQGAPPLLRMLVGLLADEGKYDEALALAGELVKEKPTDVDNHVALANVHMRKEDYPAARDELLTAQDLAEGDTEAETSVRYLLGVVYEELGLDEDAVRMWKANLTANAADTDSNNALAYHYAVKGTNLDEALELVGKALASQGDNEAYLDTLGWVYYKRGDVQKALDALMKAAAKRDDPIILDHLGDAYLASGQTGKAIEAWQKALGDKPKTNNRLAIEEKIRANVPEQSDVTKEEICPDTATGQR